MLYTRSKVAINIFRKFSSRITPPKTPIQESIFPTTISAPFLRRSSSLNHGFLKQNKVNPFLENGSKRFYCVDKAQISHSSFKSFKEWFDPGREMVPYTKRNQFLLFSKSLENKLGKLLFKFVKVTKFYGEILPATHPESVRIRLITNDIIRALRKGLNKENTWSDIGYASETDGLWKRGGEGSLKALSNEVISERGSRQQPRKQGKEKDAVDARDYLDGLNWEVAVVDEPDINAACLPGGKIFVFKGMLEHFKSDAEIATTIGHEVAHVVARHATEKMTMMFPFTIVFLVLAPFTFDDLAIITMCTLFLWLRFLRRREMEADHIGMLLIASAGYDPHVAPTVYEKLDKIITGESSSWDDYISTHPCGKTRARALAQAKVMDEALLVYRDFLSGKRV